MLEQIEQQLKHGKIIVDHRWQTCGKQLVNLSKYLMERFLLLPHQFLIEIEWK